MKKYFLQDLFEAWSISSNCMLNIISVLEHSSYPIFSEYRIPDTGFYLQIENKGFYPLYDRAVMFSCLFSISSPSLYQSKIVHRRAMVCWKSGQFQFYPTSCQAKQKTSLPARFALLKCHYPFCCNSNSWISFLTSLTL